MADTIETVPALRGLKVSRRYRRALQRLSGPTGPSPRVLGLAVFMLVFAVGFLLGRLATVDPPAGPTVRALPNVEPLALPGVEGSAVYALWSRDALATVAAQDLANGDVVPRLRLSAPVSLGEVQTKMVTLGRNVALIAGDERDSHVAFAAQGAAPHGWVSGSEAAWVSSNELLVRHRDRSLTRWIIDGDSLRSEAAGRADRLWQTPDGAVVMSDGLIRNGSQALRGRGLRHPPSGRVLSVSPDGKQAFVDNDGPAFWNGRSLERVHVDSTDVVGASYEPSGARVAMVLRSDGELTLAISNLRGNVALKPLDARYHDCPPVPTWDENGRWVYVAVGDGLLYAAEASGGRVSQVRTNVVGCGLAWVP
ncbi:MAG: hypothetical protein WD646_10415 [Actinomycetota bacterium]